MKKLGKVFSIAFLAICMVALFLFPYFKVFATETAGISTSSGSVSFSATGAIAVDPGLTVTGETLDGAKVMIENLKSGDVLGYAGSSLPSGVNGTWNTTTGVLIFTGSATATQWQTLLRTVTFNTTSADVETRSISFSLGSAIPLSGHYYEYISASVSWTTAKDNAAGRTYFGMQGYLATITSAEENQFIFQKLKADAWIGSSDNPTYTGSGGREGYWYWVTGPEAGTLFSVGNSYPVLQPGKYMNWNNFEPNNSGSNEHYGEIYSSANNGKWNDLPNSSLLGYVVEYGGTSGDPTVQVSAKKSVSIDINYSITYVLNGGANYDNAPVSYTAKSDTIILGTPSKVGNDFAGWYDAATGGNRITQITQGSTGNKTLYARWTTHQFTVTFKDHNNTELKTQTVLYGGSATPPTDPDRTGYTFLSWSGSYTNVTANQTVTATYTPNTNTAYIVNHYQQNVAGDGYTLKDTDNLTGTTDTTATAIAKTYTGFQENTTYVSRVASGNIAPNGSLVLALYYDRDEFTVTFKDHNNTELKTQTVLYGGSATPPTDPDRTGYTFLSWSGSYTNVTANQTVTATYLINTYVIYYNSMGGSAISDANVDFETKATKPENPVKAGNKFAGWYQDANYSSIWDFSINVMSAADVTLYAKWISTPTAPALLVKSATTIKLLSNADNNLEYRMNGGIWWSSTLFTNLTPDTEYLFEVRVAAHGLDPSSLISEPAVIRTNKVYITSSENSNSITGVGNTSFDPGTEFVIDNVSQLAETGDSAAYKVNFVLADEGKEVAELYDVKLLLNGQPIQPNGMIRIRIKLSDDLLAASEYLQIIYINDEGNYEVIPHLIDGDTIVFEVDHLSQYAIVAQVNSSDDVSAVAKNSFNTVILIGSVFAIIISIIILFWIWKRRKKETADEQQN